MSTGSCSGATSSGASEKNPALSIRLFDTCILVLVKLRLLLSIRSCLPTV